MMTSRGGKTQNFVVKYFYLNYIYKLIQSRKYNLCTKLRRKSLFTVPVTYVTLQYKSDCL